ncbi:MAG: hypothetical protein ACTHYV_05675 [Psychroflexus sp.]
MIEGKSITDFSGDHRTTSEIKGRIDYENDRISYAEVKNLSTKSNYDEENFCYIHLTNADFNLKKRKSSIKGNFQGKFPDGENCAEGELILVGSEFFYKRMEKLNRKISRVKKIDSVTKANLKTSTFKRKLAKNLLENEDVISLYIDDSSEVFLELWDEELEDGDKIDLFINQKIVLENFEIKNQKKIIKIPFSNSDVSVTVIANNVGQKAPNTVSLILRDKNNSHKIRTKLQQDEQAYIMLKSNQ